MLTIFDQLQFVHKERIECHLYVYKYQVEVRLLFQVKVMFIVKSMN